MTSGVRTKKFQELRFLLPKGMAGGKIDFNRGSVGRGEARPPPLTPPARAQDDADGHRQNRWCVDGSIADSGEKQRD